MSIIDEALSFGIHHLCIWILVKVQDAQSTMLNQAVVISLSEYAVEHDCVE